MAFNKQQLIQQWPAITSLISQICRISGTPGASIAIAQHGEQILEYHHGYRDVEAKEIPNMDTLYSIASLSKGMAAAAAALLVAEGKFGWDTPVTQILPGFHQTDKTAEQMISITDLLAHRTGLSPANSFWSQGRNKVCLPKTEGLATFGHLQRARDFRSSFLYNNLGYWIVDEIISHVTGQKYGSFLAEKVIEPLGMTRTSIKANATLDNAAKAYMPMRDGTFANIPLPQVHDDTLAAAAGGVRSSARDLLLFYSAILASRGAEAEFSGNGSLHAQENIIKRASYMTSGHNFLAPTSELEQTYGLGFARNQLPGPQGAIGTNPPLVKKMPCLGRNGPSCPLVIYHQGSCPGFLSTAIMIPEFDLVLVVLTNALAFNDAADWLGQMMIEYIIDAPFKNNFVHLATESRDSAIRAYDQLDKALNEQAGAFKTRPPAAYVGNYRNRLGNFVIRVAERDGNLQFHFQDEADDVYLLKPCGPDTLSWGIPYEEQARRGRWPLADAEFFKFTFKQAKAGGRIVRLEWRHDPNFGADVFYSDGAQ